MNTRVKETVKLFVPPVVFKIFARDSFARSFTGNYSSWDEALAHSTGYDSPEILNKVTEALLNVKRGKAEYERDSVLFDSIEYSWPLLSGLLLAAAKSKGRLSVVDVGGSLGSSFYQNRKFLSHLESVRWNVVEQMNFVEAGKKYFADSRLRFYTNLGECFKKEKPTVAILSSVLPYVKDPYSLLDEIMRHRIDIIIVDRTMFLQDGLERIVVQHVPKEIYPASYPCWIFNENKFRSALAKKYDIIEEFVAHAGVEIDLGDTIGTFKGCIAIRR